MTPATQMSLPCNGFVTGGLALGRRNRLAELGADRGAAAAANGAVGVIGPPEVDVQRAARDAGYGPLVLTVPLDDVPRRRHVLDAVHMSVEMIIPGGPTAMRQLEFSLTGETDDER